MIRNFTANDDYAGFLKLVNTKVLFVQDYNLNYKINLLPKSRPDAYFGEFEAH
jgi:hypothetical protein